MTKSKNPRLILSVETLRKLDAAVLSQAVGGIYPRKTQLGDCASGSCPPPPSPLPTPYPL